MIEISKEILDKVLEPYKTECQYLIKAESDYPITKGIFKIPHSFYTKEGVNSGHFNAEIDVAALIKKAKKSRQIRNFITEYILFDGSKRYVLGEGRLINLVAAEGHPAEVMDLSFANQALACEFLLKHKGKLKNKVYTLPPKIDQNVARLKLKAMGVKFDRLTQEQRSYLHSWQEGT